MTASQRVTDYCQNRGYHGQIERQREYREEPNRNDDIMDQRRNSAESKLPLKAKHDVGKNHHQGENHRQSALLG